MNKVVEGVILFLVAFYPYDLLVSVEKENNKCVYFFKVNIKCPISCVAEIREALLKFVEIEKLNVSFRRQLVTIVANDECANEERKNKYIEAIEELGYKPQVITPVILTIPPISAKEEEELENILADKALGVVILNSSKAEEVKVYLAQIYQSDFKPAIFLQKIGYLAQENPITKAQEKLQNITLKCKAVEDTNVEEIHYNALANNRFYKFLIVAFEDKDEANFKQKVKLGINYEIKKNDIFLVDAITIRLKNLEEVEINSSEKKLAKCSLIVDK